MGNFQLPSPLDICRNTSGFTTQYLHSKKQYTTLLILPFSRLWYWMIWNQVIIWCCFVIMWLWYRIIWNQFQKILGTVLTEFIVKYLLEFHQEEDELLVIGVASWPWWPQFVSIPHFCTAKNFFKKHKKIKQIVCS